MLGILKLFTRKLCNFLKKWDFYKLYKKLLFLHEDEHKGRFSNLHYFTFNIKNYYLSSNNPFYLDFDSYSSSEKLQIIKNTIFFFYQGFHLQTLKIHTTAGKERGPSSFLSTTSIRTQTFTEFCM